MREEHVILCGGLMQKIASSAIVHKFQLGKGNRLISLDAEALTEKMVEDLPPAMHDLLEIATYVYVADQAITRGGVKEFEYGEKWNRILRFIIPVREYDIWSDPEMRQLLEDTLSFASGDTYRFEFRKQQEKGFPGFLNLRPGGKNSNVYDEVLLFSGGLDSFTGVIEEVVGHRRHAALVSHQSNNKITSLQQKLYNYVGDACEPNLKPLHVPVTINKDKRLTRETSQRSRSFLYASLGTIIAHMFGLKCVKFYENGIVSCNLPYDGQTLQARATRSTHPKLLRNLSMLMSELLEAEFRFENPYFCRTKTEVCLRLKELHHHEKIEGTRSCARSMYVNPKTHCGVCSQCIDRRFGTLASECGKYDPDYLYALNIFTGDLKKGDDRAMAAGFAGFAHSLEATTIDGFIQKFSDVHEIAGWMEGRNYEQNLVELFELHRRHAEQVNRVIDAKCKENIASVRKGVLPPTCLISMIVSGEHRNFKKLPEPTPDETLANLSRKKRPTAAEMMMRNKAVAMAAAEIRVRYERLPTVDEVMAETKLDRQQVYATDAYKEGKIARVSAKPTKEITGSSVTGSEQFGNKSTEHSRADRRSKADQAEIDALIEQQAKDDKSDVVQ